MLGVARYFRPRTRGLRFCYTAPNLPLPNTGFDDEDEHWDTSTVSAALVGAPNAGKSSLSNALAGNRVSAVSRKINTTRHRTVAVHTDATHQLELWDTPGIVEKAFLAPGPRDLRRSLASDGWGAAADADVAVLVVDGSRSPASWRHVARVASQLVDIRRSIAGLSDAVDDATDSHTEQPRDADEDHAPRQLLVITKADLARPKSRLLEAADFFREHIPHFEDRFGVPYMTSTRTGRGVDDVRSALLQLATPGPFAHNPTRAYADDELSLVRQHIWEKLLHSVHQEVPYRCTFENEEFFTTDDGALRIVETIRVPTRGAMSKVIGTRGRTIDWICTEAASSAGLVLARDVQLSLRVALRKR